MSEGEVFKLEFVDDPVATEAATANGELPRAVEQAYSILRKAILSGELAANTVLQEREIAQRIGVSRTPIREALSWLRSEGLIVMDRYRKHFVAPFEEPDRREIIEIRALLEGNLAARASSRLSVDELSRLHQLCAEMEEVLEQLGDEAWPRFVVLNQEFHGLIWGAADSPRTERLLESSLSLPFNTLGRYDRNLARSMQRACWYHREIVAAFDERDESRARGQMSAHVLSLINHKLDRYTEAVPADALPSAE